MREYIDHSSISYALEWNQIDMTLIKRKVKKIQMRIAKAVRNNKYRLVQKLQYLLTRSFYAKILAVKRVTSNSGRKTPGIDGVKWNTDRRKLKAIFSLNWKSYKSLPLRRIYIEKKNGKLRPLGIPTMSDRAHQALYALALEPVAETTADPNSYGFRPYRSTKDAMGQCFCSLAKRYSPKWILEADIKGCFDNINHDWLIKHIPMEKKILKTWLKSGYIDGKKFFETKNGTPQGGVISPILMNMTLDGIERAIKSVASCKKKINVIRYADDFIVTGESKELLQEKVMPKLKEFLAGRGLSLSEEKTQIVHIEDGFDFLGQNYRKYNNKLIIKPSNASIKAIKSKLKEIFTTCRGNNLAHLIKKLNPIVRGWANYHRHICASKAFSKLDNFIFTNILKWMRRGTGKSYKWILEKYVGKIENHTRRFKAKPKGSKKYVVLAGMFDAKIRRYIKIRGAFNPHLREWLPYLAWRAGTDNLIRV